MGFLSTDKAIWIDALNMYAFASHHISYDDIGHYTDWKEY